jgi:hypothetical protein
MSSRDRRSFLVGSLTAVAGGWAALTGGGLLGSLLGGCGEKKGAASDPKPEPVDKYGGPPERPDADVPVATKYGGPAALPDPPVATKYGGPTPPPDPPATIKYGGPMAAPPPDRRPKYGGPPRPPRPRTKYGGSADFD